MAEEEKKSCPLARTLLDELIQFLGSKVTFALRHACFIAGIKKDDREEFIKNLSMEEFCFILFLYGLMNKDLVLCGLTARALSEAQKKFSLPLYRPELEIWARRTFSLRPYFVLKALNYSTRVRKARIFFTPKGIYRILAGSVDRILVRPVVREALLEIPACPLSIKAVNTINTESDESASAIDDQSHSSLKSAKKTEEKTSDEEFYIRATEHFPVMLGLYKEHLNPKVLEALKFAGDISIYREEFSLKNMGASVRQFYILFLYSLNCKDPVLLACTLHWFALSSNKIFPVGEDFISWIKNSFSWNSHKRQLLSALWYIKKLRRTDLFYFPSEILLVLTRLAESIQIRVHEVMEKNERKKGHKKNEGANELPREHAFISINTIIENKQSSDKSNLYQLSPTDRDGAIQTSRLPFKGFNQSYLNTNVRNSTSPRRHNKRIHSVSPKRKRYFHDKSYGSSSSSSTCGSERTETNFLVQNKLQAQGPSLPVQQPLQYPSSYSPKFVDSANSSSNSNYLFQSQEQHLTGWNLFPQMLAKKADPVPLRQAHSTSMTESVQYLGFFPTQLKKGNSSNFDQLKYMKPGILTSIRGEKEVPSSTSWAKKRLVAQLYSSDSSSSEDLHGVASSPIPPSSIPSPPPPPMIGSSQLQKSSSSFSEDFYDDGAFLNELAREKDSALKMNMMMKAASEGRVSTLKLLMKGNTDLQSWNEDGRTLLHITSKNGHEDATEFLLLVGLDPNSQDNLGWTPLHHAIAEGNSTVVEILLEHNANVAIKSKSGFNAYDLAVNMNRKHIADMIREFMAQDSRV